LLGQVADQKEEEEKNQGSASNIVTLIEFGRWTGKCNKFVMNMDKFRSVWMYDMMGGDLRRRFNGEKLIYIYPEAKLICFSLIGVTGFPAEHWKCFCSLHREFTLLLSCQGSGFASHEL
jgi:hypothetical protein